MQPWPLLVPQRNAVAEILVQEYFVTIFDQPLMQLGGQHVVLAGMTHEYFRHRSPLTGEEPSDSQRNFTRIQSTILTIRERS